MRKKLSLFLIFILLCSCNTNRSIKFLKQVSLENYYKTLLKQKKVGINPIVILSDRTAKKYSDLKHDEKEIFLYPSQYNFVEKGTKFLDEYIAKGSINGVIMIDNAVCCGGGRRHNEILIVNNEKYDRASLSNFLDKSNSIEYYNEIYCRTTKTENGNLLINDIIILRISKKYSKTK